MMNTLCVFDKTELCPIQYSDSEDIFNAIDSQRDYLGEWLPFVVCTNDIGFTKSYVDSILKKKDFDSPTFTIRQNGAFAGMIGLKDTDMVNKKTEIGYWLCRQYQGQGIVTRSVEKLCDVAFNNLGLNRVQIKCAVGNHRSSAIPKRLGFVFEGIERDGEQYNENSFFDIEVYSKLKKEFKPL